MEIRPYKNSDQEALLQLWTECGLITELNNPIQDIQRKSMVNPEWLLVGLKKGEIIASCMVGYEGHRGWINYLAVTPTEQRQGYAHQMMTEAERLLKDAGCPKINLQVRSSNASVVAFYESIGFKVDPVIGLGKRLENDAPYQVT